MLLLSIFLVSLYQANALRIPDTIYITTQSPIDEQTASGGLRTDLIAPEPTSISQYFQEQTPFNHQPYNFQLNPFLFRSPVMFMEDLGRLSFHQSEKKDTAKSLPSPAKSSYDLYRPSPEDNPEFVDMTPPEIQDEPNYYAVKPRKNKKYSKSDKFEKKSPKKVNHKLKEKIIKSEEVPSSVDYDDYELETQQTSDVRTERETEDKKAETENSDDDFVEESAPASRLDFSMHGHKGPDTYKFGFTTGNGENRQFKIEEKDENGDVFGQYGYRDDEGKFRVVKYSSPKDGGFKVL